MNILLHDQMKESPSSAMTTKALSQVIFCGIQNPTHRDLGFDHDAQTWFQV